jgi:hypothetical protein
MPDSIRSSGPGGQELAPGISQMDPKKTSDDPTTPVTMTTMIGKGDGGILQNSMKPMLQQDECYSKMRYQ